ncbi:Spy/CpxP family protein refolding chaperone [Motilimonas pumila]|uniref:Periplasmic heavy metal sensor n=1 Tax=Motilimonas pumila TaxID=2303987 RepID=A0A418YHF7_9GAMM|nr:Spy/CpxP family protein refolding chaperone [Motilimonas pumila]RJG49484.1 periplasmic heavy metal sensor [Motilimonas pumila]
MKQFLKVAALSLVLPFSAAQASPSEQNTMPRGGGMKQVMQALDLSEVQKQQIKDIMKDARQGMQREDRRANREEAQQDRLALLQAESFDSAKAQQLIASQQQDMAKKQLKMLQVQHKIYHVLTAEQQQQFIELMQQPKGRGGKR